MTKKKAKLDSLVKEMLPQIGHFCSKLDLEISLELCSLDAPKAIKLILACQACGITVSQDFVKLLRILSE